MMCRLFALVVTVCFLESAALSQGLLKDQQEGFKLAPIPIIQPVTAEGAGLALVYGYHLNPQNRQDSSSSYTSLGGFVTGNRSWGAGVAQNFYFDNDRWYARAIGSYADVRYNYFGIGTEAGDSGISVLMKQKGVGAVGDLLYRVYGLWYAGPHYVFLKTESSFRENPEFDSSSINPSDLNLRTGSLGPRITRDSRTDQSYPREGSVFDLRVGFSGAYAGGELKYQTYDLSYRKYISLSPSQVIAVRGAACLVGGTVPFFDECLLSASENLRGYQASRYRDRSMLASQAEYRLEVGKRFGLVAFGGAGEVGPRFGDFQFDNVLPGGGIGARYRFTRESHVNLRFDYAWGKNSHQTYFYIGEAF